MRFEAARKFDAGEDCGAEANMAKLLAADASWEAANACIQFHGGFGFAAEYDVERKFRETRLYQVAPISTNLILSYVARAYTRPAAVVLRRKMNAEAMKNPAMAGATGKESAALAVFSAGLRYEDIPQNVIDRTVDFFVDWAGSALSGAGQRAIISLEKFAATMGPADGRSEILVSRKMTSPLFAALVNAAASHISEQDDVHNGSVFHPAAVVFPAALATAQHIGSSGREFIAASVAGYEVGIRVGEFLGRSHYRVFHTTGTAGTIAAAVAVGRLLGLDPTAMLARGRLGRHAGGRAVGIPARRRRFQAAPHRQGRRRRADRRLSRQGRLHRSEAHPGGQAGHGGRHVRRRGSGEAHRSSRHTLGRARDLLQVPCLVPPHAPGRRRAAQGGGGERSGGGDIAHVVAHVHQGAIDVLGPVIDPVTVHQAKFSMPATLGLIAAHRRAGMAEFDGYS